MGSGSTGNLLLRSIMKTLSIVLAMLLVAGFAELHAGQPTLTVSDRVICNRDACSNIRNRDLFCLNTVRGIGKSNGHQAGSTTAKGETSQGSAAMGLFPCRSFIDESYDDCLRSSPGLRNPGQQRQGQSNGGETTTQAKLVTRQPSSLSTK